MKYIYALIVIAVVSSIQIASAATLSSDSFGECVTEEFLDSPGAFSKFSEMPRTCVGDCEEVTASEYHYDILGREPTPMEYDGFLRKQDDVCPVSTPRARFTEEEMTEWVFGGPERGPGNGTPGNGPPGDHPGNGIPGWGVPGNGPPGDHPGNGIPGWGVPGNGPPGDHPGNGIPGWGNPGEPPVPAVPVPSAIFLMLTGIGALAVRKFF